MAAGYRQKGMSHMIRHRATDTSTGADGLTESQHISGSAPALTPGPGRYLKVRGAVERLLALAMLGMLAPLIAALAIVVRRTSPGPALYRQERLGRNGTQFKICKLRTMHHN